MSIVSIKVKKGINQITFPVYDTICTWSVKIVNDNTLRLIHPDKRITFRFITKRVITGFYFGCNRLTVYFSK